MIAAVATENHDGLASGNSREGGQSQHLPTAILAAPGGWGILSPRTRGHIRVDRRHDGHLDWKIVLQTVTFGSSTRGLN
jgi:hypothetical protein